MIKLQNACTARPIQAKELFQNEFTCVSEVLFKYGKPYHSVKSKLLQFIEFPSTPEDKERYNLASMRGLVVDLSVVIVAKGDFANRKDSCFDDFAKRVLRRIAKHGKAGNADRIDIVADLYDQPHDHIHQPHAEERHIQYHSENARHRCYSDLAFIHGPVY